MAEKKYLEKDQLLYFWTLLKEKLAKKVDKEVGKGLSANDFTNTLKTKLDGIENGAEVNTVISVNGQTGAVQVDVPEEVLKYTVQTLEESQKQQARTNIDAGISNFSGSYTDLSNKPTIPTRVGQLSNDKNYQTDTQVTSSINTAIAGLGTVFDLKGSKATVDDLPTSRNTIGDVWFVESESVGYIWLKPSAGSERWEMFGQSIDLSGYWSKAELVEMTNADVDEVLNS